MPRVSTCGKCNKEMLHYNLERHLGRCLGKGRTCPVCKVELNDEEMNKHLHECASKKYPCLKCGEEFFSARARKIHKKQNHPRPPPKVKRRRTTCGKCGKEMNAASLERHLKVCTGEGALCPVCQKIQTGNKEDIDKHFVNCGRKFYECKMCTEKFSTGRARQLHQNRGCRPPKTKRVPDESGLNIIENGLDGFFKVIEVIPLTNETDSISILMSEKARLAEIIKIQLEIMKALRYQLNIKISLEKFSPDSDNDKEEYVFFRGNMTIVTESTNIEETLDEQMSLIDKKLDEFVQNGSGWRMKGVLCIHINVSKYRPM